MAKRITIAVFLLSVIANAGLASGNDTATITVIASGETHAMLFPCDCPDDPGGGLAERAAAIKAVRESRTILLLDAGGFAGGGIYDDYTGGRAADSQRTLSTIRAMGIMKYDAVAIGDDDLQYGGAWLGKAATASGVPLVSANCALPGAPSWRIIVKGGVRFAVTALTSPEHLFPRDESCSVLPAVSSIRKIWNTMAMASDFRIILSHLGEETAAMLADSFPECAIIVNGHRKASQSPVITRGRTLIMQFGYQGKKLSYAQLHFSKKRRVADVEKSGWLSVGPAGGADSAVSGVLAAKGSLRSPEAVGVYDLYIMSQCSYGCAALRELTGFVKKSPRIEWNIWFIGDSAGDSLSSLHGSEEVKDEMAWCAVKARYPGRWLDFLAARSIEGASTARVLSALRLDSALIASWVKQAGRQAVADHYRRSLRLGISASPTLLINNIRFEKAIEGRRLMKEQCIRGREKSRCDSLPECFDDSDCRKKGFIGRCGSSGTCGFTPDAPFSFIALVADSTVQHPEKTVIATTEELFPNATVERVGQNSAKGRTLMKTYAPSALPLYLFGSGADKAHNFSRVESGLIRAAGGFTFKNSITPANYFPQRTKAPREVVLFVDPFFPDAVQAVRLVCTDTLLAAKVRILPVIYSDPAPGAVAPSIDEKIRQEEALRWLVMDSLYRQNYAAYLMQFIKDPGSSYWFMNLSSCGIAQDIFIRQVRARAAQLSAHWRLLGELRIKEPVTLLIENRQIAVIRSRAELDAVFAAYNSTKGKQE